MPARAMRHDMHVFGRIGSIGDRPENRVGVGRIDVVAHRDADLAAVGAQRGRALQGAPHFRARRALGEREEDHRPHVAQRLVQAHPPDALDAQVTAQVGEEHRLVGDLLDHARFARRHLADDRHEHRCAPHGDGGHLHGHVEVLERHVAVAFAERAFGLEQLGIDQPLDHDLGVGRHVEVDRRRLGDANGRARQRAGDRHLVLVDRELLRAGEHDRGGATDHDGARHRPLQRAIFLPMQVAAGAADARGHAHAEPVGRFELAAVGAHVLNAGLGIARDAQRRRQIGRRIEARRGDRHRQRA